MEVIRDILECACLAPSAHNAQNWAIGAVTDKGLIDGIADLAENGRFISQCAVCFTVFSGTDNDYWLEDGCAAAMNIITAASVHGLGTCWVAGARKDYSEAVRTLLHVPPKYSLVALVPAGYPAKAFSPVKKHLEELTFRNFWAGKEASRPAHSKEGAVRKLKTLLRRRLRALVLKWM